jgi:tetratricopeptide (TPR) repeat protein
VQTTQGADCENKRWHLPAFCLGLALITLAVFGQTVQHDFIYTDDHEYVYDNPMVSHGLTWKGLAWAFTTSHASNWHPLTWLSHMLDCQIYGLNPGGHHFTNVLLHTATVIVLFLVLRQLTGGLWRSAFVAAVFAIHPLRAESVAWVAERKDVLSGLFFVLTIGAYVRYARQSWSLLRYLLVVLMFVAGLMCKPMLVTLPLILLLLDHWPLKRKALLEKIPLLALSAAACLATIWAQHAAIKSTEVFPVGLRLENALASVMIYLRQMVWPAGLAPSYHYPHEGLPFWETGVAAVLFIGISAWAWAERIRKPWVLMGWLWYLVMLGPVLGLVQVGAEPHADRYTYLPEIGILIALTWLVAEWRPAMVAIVAVLAVLCWKQTGYWKNSETLWIHALACTKDNEVAHNNLGVTFAKQGKMEDAKLQFEEAFGIYPGYADAHGNLGHCYRQQGRLDEAIAEYRKAAEIRPSFAGVYNDLGLCLAQEGKLDEAVPEFQKAVDVKPDYADALRNLGLAYAKQGRAADAITQYQKSLQIEANDPNVENNLAWLLATSPNASLRDGGKAVTLAEQAGSLTGGTNVHVLRTLAAALAEAGRYPEAAGTAQRALALPEAQSNQRLAAELEAELRLYLAGNPFHTGYESKE